MDECELCGEKMTGTVCPDCGAVHKIDFDGRLVLLSDDDGFDENLISIF